MPYDFDTIPNRLHTNSLKWHVKPHELPMWVADMDFKIAPEIAQALQKRLEHGIFGYNILPDDYYQSIQEWWKKRHKCLFQKEWIIFSNGVIPALSSTIRTLTEAQDNIILQSPVYHAFYRCIQSNKRNVYENPLLYKNHQYHIDFDDLEEKLSHKRTTLMILCNPHNPTGNLWSKTELEKIATLCKKYDVRIISDEIHCDLTAPNASYTPFALIDPESISMLSASKAFNLAGLQGSFNVIPNSSLRKELQSAFEVDEISTPHAFSIEASIAAFREGGEWLDSLRAYLEHNKALAISLIEDQLPLKVIRTQATYLIWVDCSQITHDSKTFCAFLRKTTGLYISSGDAFGGNGRSFVRINIACPKATLQEGLARLKEGVHAFIKTPHQE